MRQHLSLLSAFLILAVAPLLAQDRSSLRHVVESACAFGIAQDWPLDYWDRSPFYIGLLQAHRLEPHSDFLALCRSKAAARDWKLTWYQRKHYGYGSTPGQVMVDLYLLDPAKATPDMIADCRQYWENARPTLSDSTFQVPYTYTEVDPLFSETPLFAMLGRALHDPRWFDFCERMFFATFDKFYVPGERLCVRDETYFADQVYWSRGNGWVVGALARILTYLPLDAPQRPRFEQTLQTLLRRIQGLQREDGLWSMDLTRSESPTETSGTAFFVYGMAYAINAGIVGRDEFLPTTLRGWQALVAHQNPDGSLGWVQPPGKGPVDEKPGPEHYRPYAQGAFLLAASEVAPLLPTDPAATVILQDSLLGSTVGEQVGGTLTKNGFVPGIGTNHILYRLPETVREGFLEVEIHGMDPTLVTEPNDNAFVAMYDGRGVEEPATYTHHFKQNFFRWNFHWRNRRIEGLKCVISCAAPTPARTEAAIAIYAPGEERDWSDEPMGMGFVWKPDRWHLLRLEWRDKTFRALVDNIEVWRAEGPFDYAPVDHRVWIGCAPSRPTKYECVIPNLTYRNLRIGRF